MDTTIDHEHIELPLVDKLEAPAISTEDKVSDPPPAQPTAEPPAGINEVVENLDPQSIRPSRFPGRCEETFQTEGYEELRAEIATAGTNTVPIRVQRLEKRDGQFEYELIYGQRRLHACRDSRIPVRAIVTANRDKEDSFLEHIRENLHRLDRSAFELGRLAAWAFREGLFQKNQHRLAKAIHKSVSQVSEALTLALLPPEVIGAFASPEALQYRDAKPLRDAVTADRNAVIAEAVRITNGGEDLKPSEIVKRLTAAAGVPVRPSNGQADIAIECEGKVFGSLKFDRTGHALMKLDVLLDDAQRGALKAQVEAFIRRKVLKLKGKPAAAGGAPA